MEAGAEVTGSRSTAVATKGQRTDHRIVEVALYFQNEIRGPGAAAAPPRPASMPVVLLSGDNAQVQLARSHGLPALKPADLNEAEAALARGAAGFTAGALRAALGQAACAGERPGWRRGEQCACVESLQSAWGFESHVRVDSRGGGGTAGLRSEQDAGPLEPGVLDLLQYECRAIVFAATVPTPPSPPSCTHTCRAGLGGQPQRCHGV